jgi:3-dehydroshikimate dehydratase
VTEVYLNSWNFRAYGLERAMRRARACGYDGVEVYAGHNRGGPRETLAEVDRLAALTGIPVRVLNFGSGVIADDAEVRRAVEAQALEAIRLAPAHGVRIINASAGSIVVDPHDWARNGSAAAAEAHYERAAAAYARLGREAERAGVLLTLEIHMNTIHDTAAAMARLLAMIGSPAVRANLDPGNMWGTRSAESAAEAVELLGAARIGYVHCKNARRVPYLPEGVDYHSRLEDGDIDYFAVVSTLHRAGFRGPYGIEYSGRGDPGVPTAADLRYLRAVLAEVEGQAQATGG